MFQLQRDSLFNHLNESGMKKLLLVTAICSLMYALDHHRPSKPAHDLDELVVKQEPLLLALPSYTPYEPKVACLNCHVPQIYSPVLAARSIPVIEAKLELPLKEVPAMCNGPTAYS